jgi:exonuclease III
MFKIVYLIILSSLLACSHGVKKGRKKGSDQDTLRIMSFNIWLGGLGGGKPIEKSVDVIRVSGAQIVGLQETDAYNSDGSVSANNGEKIAKILGWNYFAQEGTHGILTQYPIVDSTENKLGIKLKIGDDRYLWFFNSHLFYIPYQPYQLASKPYGEFPFISTEKEAVTFAKSTRETEVNEYLKEIRHILPEGWPVFLTGDFNEPSFQDWTEAAVNAGLCQLKVEWPSTKAFSDLGLTDAFRALYPDEVKFSGETWSSIDAPGEIHDRIDFVFYKGNQLKVIEAQTVGFKDEKSGIGMNDYPSDHRAVSVNFAWAR